MLYRSLRIFLLIGLLIITIDSFACSCDRVGIRKSKKEADLVFKGQVTEIFETRTNEVESRGNNQIEYIITRYTFNVFKIYKGTDKKTIELLMGQMTDCPVTFIKDKTYIVYAYTDNKKLHYQLKDQKIEPYTTTHLCTRTKRVNLLSFYEAFMLWLKK